MKKFLKGLIKIIAIILIIIIIIVATILSFGTALGLAAATIATLQMVLVFTAVGLIVCAIISPDGTKAAFKTTAKGVKTVAKGTGSLVKAGIGGLVKGLGLPKLLLVAGTALGIYAIASNKKKKLTAIEDADLEVENNEVGTEQNDKGESGANTGEGSRQSESVVNDEVLWLNS